MQLRQSGHGLPSDSLHSRKAVTKGMAKNKYAVTMGNEKCPKGKQQHAMKENHRTGASNFRQESGKVSLRGNAYVRARRMA